LIYCIKLVLVTSYLLHCVTDVLTAEFVNNYVKFSLFNDAVLTLQFSRLITFCYRLLFTVFMCSATFTYTQTVLSFVSIKITKTSFVQFQYSLAFVE